MQTTRTSNPDRSAHVWYLRRKKQDWKCVLCGAVSASPALLTKDDLPERYEELTDEERLMCPFAQ